MRGRFSYINGAGRCSHAIDSGPWTRSVLLGPPDEPDDVRGLPHQAKWRLNGARPSAILLSSMTAKPPRNWLSPSSYRTIDKRASTSLLLL